MLPSISELLDAIEEQMRRYAERRGITWPPKDDQPPASLMAGIEEDDL